MIRLPHLSVRYEADSHSAQLHIKTASTVSCFYSQYIYMMLERNQTIVNYR